MRTSVPELFHQCYRELLPRTPLPEFRIEFFPFANLNNTIRLRDGRVLVRISDLLESAPQSVLRAIAHILLAKLYRKPVRPAEAAHYRKYVGGHEMARRAHLIRQIRGRKVLSSPQGHVYHLEHIFEQLNLRFFHGLMARPRMTWSRDHARNLLGHYDPAHNAIVVSRVLDREHVPRFVVEYIVYHEMLHLKHPVKLRGSRRCVHSAEFTAEEKLFPHLDEAKTFLRTL